MSFKYNDGDLLINNKSGCILLVVGGDNGEAKWLTGCMEYGEPFHLSITNNTYSLYKDYTEDDFTLLGNLCNLSKQFIQEKKDGVSK